LSFFRARCHKLRWLQYVEVFAVITMKRLGALALAAALALSAFGPAALAQKAPAAKAKATLPCKGLDEAA
jgi:hypothetical protein